MKPIKQFLKTALSVLFICVYSLSFTQETQNGPQYITLTTMHWNMDFQDFDMATWKAVEKEFLDKVTKKNEYVMSASFYLHQMTPDNSELVFVRVYNSWDAIEKAAQKNGELIQTAWPDEKAREAFFKKRQAYYAPQHSDEIYYTLPLVKPIAPGNTKDLICYVRTSHYAFPEDGNGKEFNTLMEENFNALVKNNPLIKGYYPHRHAWGKDGTEMMEAFFLDSMTDLDKMFDGLPDLMKKAWPNEADRIARGKKIDKYFTGIHGDAVYKLVAGLSK